MSPVRVVAAQYWIRPVDSFDDFVSQVRGLVETAKDYKAKLFVLPEYFTVQLLTLDDVSRPIERQVRRLARRVPDYLELMSGLARRCGIYVVAGSIPVLDPEDDERVYNECYVFNPRGEHGVQGKLHVTRWEREEWLVSPRAGVRVFETDFGKMAVAICYDVEFPEIARAAAREGAQLLVVPSCTDERQGFLRVRYCAHARAVENQMYVVHSSTVGSLPMVPAVALNYGQSAILTPSDFAFARDGIRAEGSPNQEMLVIGDIDPERVDTERERGSVLPLRDSQTTAEVARHLETVVL